MARPRPPGVPAPEQTPQGKRLKRRRKELGLTQQELARKSHVTQATIARYEVGSIREPGGRNLILLARALGVSVEWVATGRQQPGATA